MIALKVPNILIRILSVFKPEPYCHKTELGYNCRHKVYKNGNKECN